MELHAMHLKSVGALCARTLSYESCEFELVDGISNDKIRRLYNQATELWTDLHAQLADRCTNLNKRDEMEEKIAKWTSKIVEDGEDGVLTDGMRYHLDLHRDSDSESDDEEDDMRLTEERRLRRKYRDRKSKYLSGACDPGLYIYFVCFVTSSLLDMFLHCRGILGGSSKILPQSVHRN
jgi:hypothetical protein